MKSSSIFLLGNQNIDIEKLWGSLSWQFHFNILDCPEIARENWKITFSTCHDFLNYNIIFKDELKTKILLLFLSRDVYYFNVMNIYVASKSIFVSLIVRRACFPYVWCQRRWNDWFSRVSVCIECHIERKIGAEVKMGLLDVRLRWKRIHFATRNVGNCHGKFLYLHNVATDVTKVYIILSNSSLFVGNL